MCQAHPNTRWFERFLRPFVIQFLISWASSGADPISSSLEIREFYQHEIHGLLIRCQHKQRLRACLVQIGHLAFPLPFP